MATYKLWEVYCINESAYRTVTSFTEPTECPIDAGPINTGLTTLIDEKLIIGNKSVTFIPRVEKVSNTVYFNLKSDFFFDSSTMELVTGVSILSYFENNSTTGSYDFRVYDKTNKLELGSINLSNTSTAQNSLATLDNIPTNDAVLEFHIKTNAGQDKVYINSITVEYNPLNG